MLALGWSVQSGTVPSELSFREVVARAPGEPTTITKRGTSGLDYFTPPLSQNLRHLRAAPRRGLARGAAGPPGPRVENPNVNFESQR